MEATNDKNQAKDKKKLLKEVIGDTEPESRILDSRDSEEKKQEILDE